MTTAIAYLGAVFVLLHLCHSFELNDMQISHCTYNFCGMTLYTFSQYCKYFYLPTTLSKTESQSYHRHGALVFCLSKIFLKWKFYEQSSFYSGDI